MGLLSSRMAIAHSLGRKGGYNICTDVVYSIVRITNRLLLGFSEGIPVTDEPYLVYARPFRAGEQSSKTSTWPP